ncbi:hypothetical protein AGLY_003228 [Aphis glycines]|uniref:Uncharacterized protein n=1 Tax=Aphis glycines TaxID=307491 RepID=A0A6G0U2Y3_APHGL|nr:hypothetical protein AGLY_003228 [Aphis glycines]
MESNDHRIGKFGCTLMLNEVSNPIGESEYVFAMLLKSSTNSSISLDGRFSCVEIYSNTVCGLTIGSISDLSHWFFTYLSCTCDTNELYKRCTFSCSVSQLKNGLANLKFFGVTFEIGDGELNNEVLDTFIKDVSFDLGEELAIYGLAGSMDCPRVPVSTSESEVSNRSGARYCRRGRTLFLGLLVLSNCFPSTEDDIIIDSLVLLAKPLNFGGGIILEASIVLLDCLLSRLASFFNNKFLVVLVTGGTTALNTNKRRRNSWSDMISPIVSVNKIDLKSKDEPVTCNRNVIPISWLQLTDNTLVYISAICALNLVSCSFD